MSGAYATASAGDAVAHEFEAADGDIVLAWQFNGEDRCDWPDWVKGHPDTAVHYPEAGPHRGQFPAAFISISGLQDRTIANPGDWLVLQPNEQQPSSVGILGVRPGSAFRRYYKPHIAPLDLTLEELHAAVNKASSAAYETILGAKRDAMREIDRLTLDRSTAKLPNYLVAAIRNEALAKIERACR